MSKRQTTGAASIPRLLRLAFQHAQEGREEKAWEFWNTAIERGYNAPTKTKRQLQMEINNWRMEHGLVPKPVDAKPTVEG